MGINPPPISSTQQLSIPAGGSPFHSPGLSRKRVGAPQLKSVGSLSTLSVPIEPNTQDTKNSKKLNDANVRKDSKYEFKIEDLEFMANLGQGSGGAVSKVLHRPTGLKMARKVIKLAATDENQDKIEKSILRELRIMRMCRHPYIVSFLGAFLGNDDISIMMEYMDLGTLETIYAKNGPIPEIPVAGITVQILQGLIYLYENHKIVHRDIKPGNILMCSEGFAKLADFGISKETNNTVADTFVGTNCFLAPERIREGSPCTPASDVWSLGLTIMEVALAKFPFPVEAMATAFDMMQFITQEPSPTLPKGIFTSEFDEFCVLCLTKDVNARPHPQQLMVLFL
ncbi:MAP kinase kinase (MEK) [Globomyces sp. JEL0801]|nr:MAP kinase kinase (MEK) [Globomyces sp. JEL0801]